MKLSSIIFLISVFYLKSQAQNESSKWYFGNMAALDFMTEPPTILNNSAMGATAGSSSIADAFGNLLFYTNGVTVWNQQHQVMANGSGLLGHPVTTQSALIVKQPGFSNLYYIFTLANLAGPDGLRYSIVDMSLAAGMGSVTVKNVLIYTPSSQKLAGIKHCNGSDIWILSHDYNSNNFRANLLTSAGLNTAAVISGAGTTYTNASNTLGEMKASPNGRKVGVAIHILNAGRFELYDFNRSTGIISNSLSLGSNFGSAYGCEFSPDGTKFYAGGYGGPTLYQWDLCAGSDSAIVASQDTIANGNSTLLAGMQLASNGKIYISDPGFQSLATINHPNLLGSSCNYTTTGQAVASSATVAYGLPNFISSSLKTPFTFTNSFACNTVSYTSSYVPTVAVCSAISDSISAIEWFFGEPTSGSANTSTLITPVHHYSISGTYKVKLAIHSGSCAPDTIVQYVTLPTLPPLNVSGNFTICPGNSATITATGANSYSWSNSANTSSIVVNPAITTTYTVIGSYTNTSCTSTKTLSVVKASCVGIPELENENDLVKIYPNPFQNNLSFESKNAVKISFYNQLGIFVDDYFLEVGLNIIDVTRYSRGIYLLRIETKGRYFYTKIIKAD